MKVPFKTDSVLLNLKSDFYTFLFGKSRKFICLIRKYFPGVSDSLLSE